MKLPRISLPKSRGLKYGYSNARVRAMKGLLLKPSFLDELIKVRTTDAMAELLERTPYRDDITATALRHRGSALIEFASARHFVRVARKVRKFTPAEDGQVVESLLRKWDILNLKFLINARRLGRSYEEIKPSLVPVGGITEGEYERIAKCEEGMLAKEVRGTGFGKEMLGESASSSGREALESFGKALKSFEHFARMQSLLDAYGYRFASRALAGQGRDVGRIREIFRKEVDAKNVMIIGRLRPRGFDTAKLFTYLIDGGTLDNRTIAALAEARDMDAFVKVVKQKFPKLAVKEGDAALPALEIALEKAIAAEKLRAFNRSVLSVGVLLGFLLLKEEEVHNLRKIAKAKEFGISEQDVRDMLVVV